MWFNVVSGQKLYCFPIKENKNKKINGNDDTAVGRGNRLISERKKKQKKTLQHK